MVEDLFIGIDLGTGSCKAVLTDRVGNIIAKSSERYSLYLTKGGGAEQDPEEWWKAVVKATRKITEGIDTSLVKGISITGQWSGTVAVDEKGNPLRRAIIWLDSRGEKYVRKLIRGFINIAGYDVFKLYRWLSKTGGAPSKSGKDSLAHILFIKNEEPEIYKNTYKFLEPISYINLKLTNRFVSSYDIMITHWVTDNRDIKNIKYDESLLKMAGIDREKLPDLVNSLEIIGKTTEESSEELGLKNRVPVATGGGDIQTSLIGAGCVFEYEALAYIGTSSWLTAHVPFKKTDISHNIASLPSALPNEYFIAAEQECAGKVLEFIVNLFSLKFEEIDELASKSTLGSGGLIFAPWLYGERAPVEDRFIRGALINLSLEHGVQDIVRSALEGIAFNLKWIMDPVENLMGKEISSVKLAGGGARFKTLVQTVADVLGVKVNLVEEPAFVNARASALIASLATASVDLKSIANNIKSISFFPKKENVEKYKKIFKQFIKVYRRNKSIMHSINKLY